MAKQLSDTVRADTSVDPKMADYTIDEITELAIYDAENSQARRELVHKKVRKVHAGTELVVKLVLKNLLINT